MSDHYSSRKTLINCKRYVIFQKKLHVIKTVASNNPSPQKSSTQYINKTYLSYIRKTFKVYFFLHVTITHLQLRKIR